MKLSACLGSSLEKERRCEIIKVVYFEYLYNNANDFIRPIKSQQSNEVLSPVNSVAEKLEKVVRINCLSEEFNEYF